MSSKDDDRIDASARGATAPETSGDFYKNVVQSMDEGVVIVDRDEYILFANPAAGRIVDYSQQDLIGMNLAQFVLQEDWSEILAETQKRLRGKVSRYTTRIRRRDGDIRQVEVTSSPIRDFEGRVVGAAGVFLDFTEQRRAEQQLRRSERDKAVILSTVSELVNYQDAELRVLWANRAAGESVGQDPADLVGRYCYEIWHGRDRPCDDCPLLKGLQSGRPQNGRVTTPDGRFWKIRSYPVHGPDGQVAGAVEVTSEITEQVRAEEAMRRYAQRLEVLHDLDRTILAAGSLTEISRAAIRYVHRLVDCFRSAVIQFDLDRSTATVLATNMDELPDAPRPVAGDVIPLEAFQNLDGYARNEPRVVRNLSSLENPNELQKMLLQRGVGCYFSVPMLVEGRLVGVVSVGFDRPEAFDDEDLEIAAEVANPLAIAIDRERRERERARLAAVVEQTDEAVAVLTPSGQTIYVNPAAERVSGYSSEQILANGNNLFLADDTARLMYQQMWHELNEGRTWSGRVNLRRADGSVFPADVNCSPLRDEGGAVTSYILVGHDATEKAELEAKLRQGQKMEAIGRLAGGVAHDFNNILTVILGNAELLEQSHASDPNVAPVAKEILHAGRQAADLTQQLLAFARKGKFRVETVDLHKTIREVIALLKPESKSNVKIAVDLTADDPRTIGDETQLKMAMMNLGINAFDAMDGQGTLTFATRNVTIDAEHESTETLPPGDYLEISVSDTGCGMDESTKTRIFEPFFTTKDVGRGTGMGLPSLYGAVKYHGGSVQVDTAPGRGTTFHLLLPTGAVENGEVDDRADSESPATGRILLVDDEDDVRGFATRALTRAGFRVTDCGDPAEALDIYLRDPSAFSLVVADLIMPDISGRELFVRIRQMDPDARFAITSGAEHDHIVRGLLAAGAVGFVPKPFDTDTLISAVRQFLTVQRAGKIA